MSTETLPTRITLTCRDCGTTTTCDHPDGIGGEGQGWSCPVCGDTCRAEGSNYPAAPTSGSPA